MKSALLAPLVEERPRRIAVFRTLQLGDLMCAVPALRALRQRFASAELSLIGLPWASGFARRFAHLIDRFEPFPGYPGLPESEADIARIPDFFLAQQRRRYDLAIQLHGSGRTVNDIVTLLGAHHAAGFTSQPPGALILNVSSPGRRPARKSNVSWR